MSNAPILICYDGSDDAKAAIKHGGSLLRGAKATVLTVWQPLALIVVHSPIGFGLPPALPDADKIDRASAEAARAQAEEGAELARQAGFEADSRTCAQVTTTSEAILADARALGADAILMGSRGLTGLKSLMLGSVSHGVVQHADRAVIIEPSTQIAA